jgi:hypothetical protein
MLEITRALIECILSYSTNAAVGVAFVVFIRYAFVRRGRVKMEGYRHHCRRFPGCYWKLCYLH